MIGIHSIGTYGDHDMVCLQLISHSIPSLASIRARAGPAPSIYPNSLA
jgi:hypothetical protein